MFEDADGLLASVLSMQMRDTRDLPARPADALFVHLEQLRNATEDRRPQLRAMLDAWQRRVATSGIGLSRRTILAVRSLAAVSTLLAPSGAWFLTGSERR
jgi:hypothetical protein